jgi:2-polyprenyl-3-methyl-5-hydroxy-6-metoxy-1,4-benzoquinol methylase
MNLGRNELDRSAEFYSVESAFDKKLIEFRFRALLPHIRGESVLELGPGSGEMTRKISEIAKKLTVVEGSKEILSSVPDLKNLKKIHSYFELFDPEDKFDTIIAEHVLEHVEDPIHLLKIVREWLAPGGSLIVGVPNSHSIHRRVAVKMGLLKSEDQLNSRDLQFGHRRVYDFDLLTEHLMAAGYRIRHKSGIFFKPLSNSQINEQWTDEMIEGFYMLGCDYPELCAEIQMICESD